MNAPLRLVTALRIGCLALLASFGLAPTSAAPTPALDTGARVLLTIPPARVRNDAPAKVALGILCDPSHPALADFPTDFHSNWQWWYLASRATPLRLDDLPPATKPIVQVIDDWFTARKLGLVFEAQVRRGRLLVCSIHLTDAASDNPVARQLRSSLLRYMASDRFAPTVPVNESALARLSIPQPYAFKL